MSKLSTFFIIIVSCFFFFSCLQNKLDCIDPSIDVDLTKSHRKVLIIGVDGFRADAIQPDISPFLFSLSESKTTYYNNRHLAVDIPWSGPNWSSILTGVQVDKHQVERNDFSNHNFSNYPHFFEYAEKSSCGVQTVSLVNWLPINEHIAPGSVDYAPKETLFADKEIYKKTIDILVDKKPINPDFMFTYFHDLDAAGHVYGFSPDVTEYAETVSRVDSYIEDIFWVIERKRADGEDWMVIITSDHGGEDIYHSDYSNPNISNTILIINNPNVSFNHQHESTQVDIAPTVLDFRGIKSAEFDRKTDGVSILK